MLLGGRAVTPIDWWSAQWVEDRITRGGCRVILVNHAALASHANQQHERATRAKDSHRAPHSLLMGPGAPSAYRRRRRAPMKPRGARIAFTLALTLARCRTRSKTL